MYELEELKKLFTAIGNVRDLIDAIDMENAVTTESKYKSNIDDFIQQLYPLTRIIYDYFFKKYFDKYWEVLKNESNRNKSI